MAQAENKDLLKEQKSSLEETVLINRKVGFGHNSSKECAEDENVLGQTKLGPKRWFISKGDNPKNSIGVDKHCKDNR